MPAPTMTISASGLIPRGLWDKEASRQLGLAARATIQARTFDRGHGLDDSPHKPYSRKPIYVSRKAFPRPRGGTPSRTGRSVRYPLGYWQYKRDTLGTAKVNLTRSGQMRRDFKVTRYDVRQVVLGIRGRAERYGVYTHNQRPWAGLSPSDRRHIVDLLPRLILEAQARSMRGRR